ncbi:hypothetical protein [Massilia sp. UYP11]|uniref:hypothetical protein n=1 Tax=Massilia sp. UYP11 TaxID=1756385 RepID=UPI003D1ED347
MLSFCQRSKPGWAEEPLLLLLLLLLPGESDVADARQARARSPAAFRALPLERVATCLVWRDGFATPVLRAFADRLRTA